MMEQLLMLDIPPRHAVRLVSAPPAAVTEHHHGFGPPHMLDVPWEIYAAAIVWVCRTCRPPPDGRNK